MRRCLLRLNLILATLFLLVAASLDEIAVVEYFEAAEREFAKALDKLEAA